MHSFGKVILTNNSQSTKPSNQIKSDRNSLPKAILKQASNNTNLYNNYSIKIQVKLYNCLVSFVERFRFFVFDRIVVVEVLLVAAECDPPDVVCRLRQHGTAEQLHCDLIYPSS